jgi:hypothetical protein
MAIMMMADDSKRVAGESRRQDKNHKSSEANY